MEFLYPSAALVLGLIIVICVHVYTTSIVSSLLGYVPSKVSIGFGKALLSFYIKGINFRFGILPLGGYNEYDKHAEATWYKKLIINLAGPLACILFAFAIIGDEALAETLQTWPQLYGLVTDYSFSFDFFSIIKEIHDSHGLLFLTALIATKNSAYNLLPLPLLPGGQALYAIREGITGSDISPKVREVTAGISLVILLTITAVFLSRALF